LTDTIIGMKQAEALEFAQALVGALTGHETEIELGKLRALQGVREFPSRVKCATLAWHAMKSALRQEQRPASTE
jgi:nitrogen fixation NifU-like protein